MTDVIPPEVTDRDVYITRSFSAPIATVWKFWTEPERLAEWFGPVGIHTPLAKIDVDLKDGGHWNLVMTDDATGDEFPMSATIVKMMEPEYLEMQASAETSAGDIDHIFLRIQLHDHGDTTRMTLHQGPFTPELKEQTSEGWEMSFVKLDGLFAQL